MHQPPADILKKVKEAIRLAEKLIGTPYAVWDSQNDKQDMFYTNQVPPINQIQEKGINCAGLINVLRQNAGTAIPENKPHYVTNVRGGTKFWEEYFKVRGVLEKFNYQEKYNQGTLFMRSYRNEDDQGHMAILHSYDSEEPGKLLYGRIIHAYSGNPGQVGLTTFGYSHFWSMANKHGYYEYAIRPQDWLTDLRI